MDLEKVFNLIDKAEKSSFNKIKIQIEDVKLSLERNSSEEVFNLPNTVKKEKSSEVVEEDLDMIYAPISGVFYVAKEPGAEPFVKEGSKVKKGDTVCIIEAMKMLNEICAPKSGVIKSVLKTDAQAIIEKDALFRYAKEK